MLKISFIISSILAGFFANYFSSSEPSKDISTCVSVINNVSLSSFENYQSIKGQSISFEADPNLVYSMPALSKTSSGKTYMTWTEKDESGMVSLCMAYLNNDGLSFDKKKVVHTASGIGNSRFSRAKVLSKKNGDLIAVFSKKIENSKNGRASNLVYNESKDQGNTWSSPQNVDSDPTEGIVRGFFDAVIMSNDEIAVTYLKDVANSTKHEERDLRLVISKNGSMLPEKLIDPVVCDCCPINMMVDEKGQLNIFYRDNNDNIRDIAQLVSKDNGASFAKPTIILKDNWEINGCPHNGVMSTLQGSDKYLAWYSGTKEEPGIRLTKNGKKLSVISESSAKNQFVSHTDKSALFLWDQTSADSKEPKIAFKKITGDKVSETFWLENANNNTNVSAIGNGNDFIVVSEKIMSNKKNQLMISFIKN